MFGLFMGALHVTLRVVGEIVNNNESNKFREYAKKENKITYIDHYGATRLTSNNHHTICLPDKNGDLILYDCGFNDNKKVPVKNYSEEQRAIKKQKWIDKQILEGKRFIDPEEKRGYDKYAPILLDRKHNMRKCKTKGLMNAVLVFDATTKKIYDYDISRLDKNLNTKLKAIDCHTKSFNYAHYMEDFIRYIDSEIENFYEVDKGIHQNPIIPSNYFWTNN